MVFPTPIIFLASIFTRQTSRVWQDCSYAPEPTATRTYPGQTDQKGCMGGPQDPHLKAPSTACQTRHYPMSYVGTGQTLSMCAAKHSRPAHRTPKIRKGSENL